MIGNTLTLVGNITQDPEVKFSQGGTSITRFGLAVNRRWTDRTTNEQREDTMFVDVVCFNGLGDNVVRSLHKGDSIIVEGRLNLNTWTTDTGENRRRHEVVADNVGASLRWASVDITKNAKGTPAAAQETLDAVVTTDDGSEPF